MTYKETEQNIMLLLGVGAVLIVLSVGGFLCMGCYRHPRTQFVSGMSLMFLIGGITIFAGGGICSTIYLR